jgi:hypothetical protein
MKLVAAAVFAFGVLFAVGASAQEGEKSKFYDFNDQVIDGEIKKPTTLFTDARQKVKFDRLLKLKKTFLPAILDTSKEAVFK